MHDCPHPSADFSSNPRLRPRVLSPRAAERELLRQEQDNAYKQSLAADRQREAANAAAAAEAAAAAVAAAQREAEAAAAEAAAGEARERRLRSAEASLPEEPPADDPEAVSLMIRMPSGGRHTRRFRSSNRLQVGGRKGWGVGGWGVGWPHVAGAPMVLGHDRTYSTRRGTQVQRWMLAECLLSCASLRCAGLPAHVHGHTHWLPAHVHGHTHWLPAHVHGHTHWLPAHVHGHTHWLPAHVHGHTHWLPAHVHGHTHWLQAVFDFVDVSEGRGGGEVAPDSYNLVMQVGAGPVCWLQWGCWGLVHVLGQAG